MRRCIALLSIEAALLCADGIDTNTLGFKIFLGLLPTFCEGIGNDADIIDSCIFT